MIVKTLCILISTVIYSSKGKTQKTDFSTLMNVYRNIKFIPI